MGEGERRRRDVPMPADPGAHLVLVEPHFALGLLAVYYGDSALMLMQTHGREVALWLVGTILAAVVAWWAWHRWRAREQTA